MPRTLIVLGCGNMGRAIVAGGLAPRAAVLDPGFLAMADPDPAQRDKARALGVRHVYERAADAFQHLPDHADLGQVLLAVKPQSFGALAGELRPALAGSPRVVITILAGTPSAKIRDALATPNRPGVRVVRAMPNLPASIGRGCTALALGAGANPGDDAFALDLFRAVGPTPQPGTSLPDAVVRIDESMMDAFTALAGSGPAYLFYLAEAMHAAAVRMGFAPDQALAIVKATLSGAGELLAASPQHPNALRAAVTSRGGTTAAATDLLDHRAAMQTLTEAVIAARDRGTQLALLPSS